MPVAAQLFGLCTAVLPHLPLSPPTRARRSGFRPLQRPVSLNNPVHPIPWPPMAALKPRRRAHPTSPVRTQCGTAPPAPVGQSLPPSRGVCSRHRCQQGRPRRPPNPRSARPQPLAPDARGQQWGLRWLQLRALTPPLRPRATTPPLRPHPRRFPPLSAPSRSRSRRPPASPTHNNIV